MHQRIRVDTANLTAKAFEVDKKRKFATKVNPAAALADLPALGAMSPEYLDVFNFYVRKLNGLVANTRRNSREWTALKATAAALNIKVDAKMGDAQIVELLARLRALDMVERPPDV